MNRPYHRPGHPAPAQPMQPAHLAGVTLIEMACVLAIITLLASASLPGLGELLLNRRLEGLSTQLSADLQHLRSEAVSRNQSMRISFQRDATASCYVVHTGPAGSCTCLGAIAAACSGAGGLIHRVHLPASSGLVMRANVASMNIDPRLGTFSPAGSVTVESRNGRAIRHVVNILGRMRTCVPEAAQGLGIIERRRCAS